jgi:tetratricopeptide (TPR) repeat protein
MAKVRATSGRGDNRRRLWALLPAVAALLVYASTFRGEFVYDDEVLIQKNPAVRDLGFLPKLAVTPLFATIGSGGTNYYRPVPMGVYNALWQVGGGSAAPFHLMSVLVHMINAVLLMLLVRRVSGPNDLVAVGAATLFAVHPLGTEAVAWASGLPELTYAALSVATLMLHVASWSRTGRAAWAWRASACATFVLACLCKETALAVVPLIAFLELWIRPVRAERLAGGTAAAWRVTPYLLAAALYLAARSAVLGGLVPPAAHKDLTIADAALSAGWLILSYLHLMIAPWTLLVDRVGEPVSGAFQFRFLLPAALLVGAMVLVVRLARRCPDLAFATALAVVPLIPALYLPALGRDLIAERYAYLPLAGLCWLAIGGADAMAAARIENPGRTVAALTIVLVVAAGARTIARNADWRDNGSLGGATIRDEPGAAVGYLLVGNWDATHGRKEDALRVFEAGLARLPDRSELRMNQLVLGQELGRLSADQAIASYRELASRAPSNPTIAFNLGQALLTAGRLEEAEAAFRRALELAPASVSTLTALSVVASGRGDHETAARLCRRAIGIDGRSTAAYQQLGVSLLRSGDTNGAIDAFERSVAIDPSDKEGLTRLGVAYAKAGRMDDARRAWERALAIDPGFAKARSYLERLDRQPR